MLQNVLELSRSFCMMFCTSFLKNVYLHSRLLNMYKYKGSRWSQSVSCLVAQLCFALIFTYVTTLVMYWYVYVHVCVQHTTYVRMYAHVYIMHKVYVYVYVRVKCIRILRISMIFTYVTSIGNILICICIRTCTTYTVRMYVCTHVCVCAKYMFMYTYAYNVAVSTYFYDFYIRNNIGNIVICICIRKCTI
jgi:hypothetical protein